MTPRQQIGPGQGPISKAIDNELALHFSPSSYSTQGLRDLQRFGLVLDAENVAVVDELIVFVKSEFDDCLEGIALTMARFGDIAEQHGSFLSGWLLLVTKERQAEIRTLIAEALRCEGNA